jgi:3-methyl-2-oxobutanoate hydroxymethyltransferase
MPDPRPAPVTVPSVRASKVRDGHQPLVMVTAYDAPGARIVDAAGVDMILVGDSVANVVLGYEDTLQVTIDDMAHHVAAVARSNPRALVVGDLPWMSYHVDVADTVRNGATLIRAGAQCVKLEGGAVRAPMVEALVHAEIPVMGHIGLTPQSVNAFGGYRVQGRGEDGEQLLHDAKVLQAAGAFAVVLECVPAALAAQVTEALSIPTIGIGAGPACDAQVLVWQDMAGLSPRVAKFVKQYADVAGVLHDAARAFADDVTSGAFPDEEHSYK